MSTPEKLEVVTRERDEARAEAETLRLNCLTLGETLRKRKTVAMGSEVEVAILGSRAADEWRHLLDVLEKLVPVITDYISVGRNAQDIKGVAEIGDGLIPLEAQLALAARACGIGV